jgi:hypothetical protein
VGFGFLRVVGVMVRVMRLEVVDDAVVVVLGFRRLVVVVSVAGGVVVRSPDLATEVVLTGRGDAAEVVGALAVVGARSGLDAVGSVGLAVEALGTGLCAADAGALGGPGWTTRESATAAAPPASQLTVIAGRGVVLAARAAPRPAGSAVTRSTAATSRVKPRKSTTAVVTTAQSAHAPRATGTDRPELVISHAR